ncbi:hypothetical protein GH714_008874 [Hevea brasiliensis]|uniref:Protein kinase domain-containing protein n=1 Tax=Hevea brasiliensis TaxID=3981 RepID=A0A6A6MD30_HEVBR|nr:hypothetical protein GH714_008874 [Hevea brasiliensis]
MNFTSSPLFNFSASVCSWQGLFCDAEENVWGLVASGDGLSGSIPDTTIGKLTKLHTLDLSNNKITALPSDMWSLGSLTTLNLSSNQISGSLTNNIGNFGLLESLDLSSNNFSGEIPAAISSLSSLRVLKLDRNGFQGSIPLGILNCRSLTLIDISLNKLEGSLPDDFGATFPKLKTLNLAGNKIKGRDSDFSQMKSITSLNISGNLFNGSVMGVFLGMLEVIDLSRNEFQGHISQVQFNSSYNWSHLIYLDLSENQLSGDIFPYLNQAQNLKYLNLALNRFDKQEFPRIDMLGDLEFLNLSKTSLVGHVPREIAQLSNLRTLDLSENHLSGSIPLLPTKNLQVLDVSHNNLSGEIPLPLLQKLQWMERFNFSYNNLTLCASEFSSEIFQRQFYGSLNSCPIAANLGIFKRKANQHKGLKLALALTLSMVCLLAGLLFLAIGCRRKSSKWAVKQTSYKDEQNISGPFSFHTDSTTWVADVKQATSVPVVIFEKPLLNITFADLLSATSGFDRGTLLAEGKFGPVYRGFLPGGIHVAVKVLVHGSTLTDQEAARELEYLGRIKHPNLVPLTGYCVAGDQRIAIYDYMENGNLQNLLHDLPLGVQTTEDWSTDTWEEDDNNGIQNVGSEGLLTTWRFRHKIALGTARALHFFIMVFGSGLDEEIARGSPGYVPPEFSDPDNNCPTPKSDVYCYGVVLFELIREKAGPEHEMGEALKIAYLCTADIPSKRPSMQQIVGLLKDIESAVHHDEHTHTHTHTHTHIYMEAGFLI